MTFLDSFTTTSLRNLRNIGVAADPNNGICLGRRVGFSPPPHREGGLKPTPPLPRLPASVFELKEPCQGAQQDLGDPLP